MNSPFVQDRAADLAARLHQTEATDPQRVRLAFLLCFSREPEPEELQSSLQFLGARQTNQSRPTKHRAATNGPTIVLRTII
jgi:hypothetical protein